MAGVSYIVAFLAGIVSFLAPCVLPFVPGFLIYLAGTSAKEGSGKRWDIVLASILFVAGFSLVFSLLGVLLNTILNFSLNMGAALVVEGRGTYHHLLWSLSGRVIRIGWLEQEHKFPCYRDKIEIPYLVCFRRRIRGRVDSLRRGCPGSDPWSGGDPAWHRIHPSSCCTRQVLACHSSSPGCLHPKPWAGSANIPVCFITSISFSVFCSSLSAF